jgi:hypothetical protein
VQDPALAAGDMCSPAGNSQICPGFFLASPMNPAGANVFGLSGFRGDLRCFQVDSSGALVAGNALKGEAFIEGLGVDGTGIGLLSAYNSINIEGGDVPADPQTANLDGVEYARCPSRLSFNHLAPGHADPISGADVDVEFTFVPCTYSTTNATFFSVLFDTFDQLESGISGGDQRSCWANFRGSDTSGVFGRATPYLRSTARAGQTGNCLSGNPVGFGCTSGSDCGRDGICFNNLCESGDATGFVCASDANCGVGGVCGPPSGILGLAEQFYTGASLPGTSADVAHQLGIREVNDVMSFTGGF